MGRFNIEAVRTCDEAEARRRLSQAYKLLLDCAACRCLKEGAARNQGAQTQLGNGDAETPIVDTTTEEVNCNCE
jgi:hypothetical protein